MPPEPAVPPEPFWPRRSPHFLACRLAVRPFDTSPDRPAVIGLSGGPDSLALVAAAAAEGKYVRAVVVDHQLQEGSAEVAERAAAQAERLGAPAEVVRVDVAAGNVEAAAREARYAALFAAAANPADHAPANPAADPAPSATPAAQVWTAHTAEDQAETLLLGALRGNPAGMGAKVGVAKRKLLVRPFLQVRRADTVGACAELGLDAWADPMNADPAFRRVAVRTRIIPALSELVGGDAVPALAAAAARIAEGRELLEAFADTQPTTNCAALAADPAPVRRRRIAAWLVAEGVPVQGDQLAAIEALATDWHGQGPVHVAGGTVARVGGRLVLRR